MESRLDILMWDEDLHQVEIVCSKYPFCSLQAVDNSVDFLYQLNNNPKLVIINTITFDQDHVLKLLAEGLTQDAYVVTFAPGLQNRVGLKAQLRKHGVLNAVSFEANSVYLWISLYNILKPSNNENNYDQRIDCEIPAQRTGSQTTIKGTRK